MSRAPSSGGMSKPNLLPALQFFYSFTRSLLSGAGATDRLRGYRQSGLRNRVCYQNRVRAQPFIGRTSGAGCTTATSFLMLGEERSVRTIEDLQPWARRAFEEAYADLSKRRYKCSRDDFASGFIAALEWAKSSSSFRVKESPQHQAR